jgi:hypothetical protein
MGMVINETADSIKRQRPISAHTRTDHPNALMLNQLALDTWFKNSLSVFLIYASRELAVKCPESRMRMVAPLRRPLPVAVS